MPHAFRSQRSPNTPPTFAGPTARSPLSLRSCAEPASRPRARCPPASKKSLQTTARRISSQSAKPFLKLHHLVARAALQIEIEPLRGCANPPAEAHHAVTSDRIGVREKSLPPQVGAFLVHLAKASQPDVHFLEVLLMRHAFAVARQCGRQRPRGLLPSAAAIGSSDRC